MCETASLRPSRTVPQPNKDQRVPWKRLVSFRAFPRTLNLVRSVAFLNKAPITPPPLFLVSSSRWIGFFCLPEFFFPRLTVADHAHNPHVGALTIKLRPPFIFPPSLSAITYTIFFKARLDHPSHFSFPFQQSLLSPFSRCLGKRPHLMVLSEISR